MNVEIRTEAAQFPEENHKWDFLCSASNFPDEDKGGPTILAKFSCKQKPEHHPSQSNFPLESKNYAYNARETVPLSSNT